MDTVVQDSSAVCQFSEITIQNDAGKCHMKFSGHLWEQAVGSSRLPSRTKKWEKPPKKADFLLFLILTSVHSMCFKIIRENSPVYCTHISIIFNHQNRIMIGGSNMLFWIIAGILYLPISIIFKLAKRYMWNERMRRQSGWLFIETVENRAYQ